MIDKVKAHVLWIVTVVLGYSGYSRAQDPDASLIEDVAVVILPEVHPEAIRMRGEDEKPITLKDPFKVAERFDMSRYAQPIEDDYNNAVHTGDSENKVPIIALESTLSFGGRQSAYFSGKSVDRGEVITTGPNGQPVKLIRVDTLKVIVEYMDEHYTLHLQDSPRLQIGLSKAVVMGRARQNNDGSEVADDPTKSSSLDALRERAEEVNKALKGEG